MENYTTEEILKVLATRFYLDIDLNKDIPECSDLEYDVLSRDWENQNPGRSVKDLVDWDSKDKVWREPHSGLPKEKYMPEEILGVIKNDWAEEVFLVTYKYDGCAVEAEYTEDGYLKRILGTPDEEYGFIRTHKLWNFFPHQIDCSLRIKRIFGEVLVDTELYGHRARNKANGLCNSQYLQDSIEEEAFVRVYNFSFFDKEYNFKRLIEARNYLKTLASKSLYKFDVAEKLDEDQIIGQPIVKEKDTNHHVLIDGYVVYSESGPFALKMYYTEYKDVRINDIEWNYNVDNGSYIPVAIYDTIILNDKENSKVSIGGVPILIEERRGVGALVRVVMSGGTIPKIIKTIEPSEDYNFPTCECGQQLSEKNIVGSFLKCENPYCIKKYEKLISELSDDINLQEGEDFYEKMKGLLPYYTIFDLVGLLHIDRFNPISKFKVMSLREKANRFLCSTSLKIGYNLDEIKGEVIEKLGVMEENWGVVKEALQDFLENSTDESFDRTSEIICENSDSNKEYESIANRAREEFLEACIGDSPEKLREVITQYFSMSGLQKRNMEVYLTPLTMLLHRILNN